MNEKELLSICNEYTLRTPQYNEPPIFQRGYGILDSGYKWKRVFGLRFRTNVRDLMFQAMVLT